MFFREAGPFGPLLIQFPGWFKRALRPCTRWNRETPDVSGSPQRRRSYPAVLPFQSRSRSTRRRRSANFPPFPRENFSVDGVSRLFGCFFRSGDRYRCEQGNRRRANLRDTISSSLFRFLLRFHRLRWIFIVPVEPGVSVRVSLGNIVLGYLRWFGY